MFKSYVRVALRHIAKYRFYSVLNIAGLAVGMACFIIISLWIKDELSYDRHFANYQRIYRVESSLVTEGVPKAMAATDRRLQAQLAEKYRDICDAASVYKTPSLLTAGKAHIYQEQVLYADESFFRIFSFEFIYGNPASALTDEHSIVITESVSVKLFGSRNPVGQQVQINNSQTKDRSVTYIVTGVVKNNPANSHFHPTAIIRKTGNMDTFEIVYVMLHKGITPAYFARNVWQPLYKECFYPHYVAEIQDITLDRLQPVANIHLGGNKWEDFEANSDPMMLYVFGAIAALLLALSCINYINLATARSLSRVREIGVRKALGGTGRDVQVQFLLEAVLTALIAMLVALSILEMAIPFFSRLATKQLAVSVLDPRILLYSVVVAVLAGLASGAYPAFVLSSISAVESLKGANVLHLNRPYIRRALVVVQLTISISMLIATSVIAKQLRFLTSNKPGFDVQNMLLVRLNDERVSRYREDVKQELLKDSHVLNVAVSHNVPGGEINHTFISFETDTGMHAWLINSMFVDQDYLKIMGLKLLEGRDFDSSMVPRLDTEAFVVINESAKKLLGYENGAIGQRLNTGEHYGLRQGKIIGVVKDFHAASLHERIEPMVLTLGTIGRPEGKEKYLTIKVKGDSLDHTIARIGNIYKAYGQGYPFRYSFLDQEFNRQYNKERHLKLLFSVLALLSVLNSLLGLTGLASLVIKQRAKEVVIRRIAGASIPDLIRLLTGDFVKMALLAWLVAVPITYLTMQQWLDLFAYKVSQDALAFLVSGAAVSGIVLLTVIIQSVTVIAKNPATVLRHE